MDEAEGHPLRDEPGLPLDDRGEQRHRVTLPHVGVVPRADVLDDGGELLEAAAGRDEDEGADPQVRPGDPGEDGAGERALAQHLLAGRDGGQGPRRRDAGRVHELGDEVLPQDRSHDRAAVTAPGEGSASGPLERDVAAPAVGVDDLPEQVSATVAEHRGEVAELVAGVGLGDRFGPLGDVVAREDRDPVRGAQGVRVEAELVGEVRVEGEQLGGAHGDRVGPYPEPVELADEGVVAGPPHGTTLADARACSASVAQLELTVVSSSHLRDHPSRLVAELLAPQGPPFEARYVPIDLVTRGYNTSLRRRESQNLEFPGFHFTGSAQRGVVPASSDVSRGRPRP